MLKYKIASAKQEGIKPAKSYRALWVKYTLDSRKAAKLLAVSW